MSGRARTAATGALLAALALAPAASRAAIDCSVTAIGVNFGVFDPLLTTPDDSTGSITVTCTYTAPGPRDASYTVRLSPGTAGRYVPRQMSAGDAVLAYNLFGDGARAQVWGDAMGGTIVVTGTINLGPGVGNRTRSQTHTIYGRLPALQDVEPGSYNDTIVVTLDF